MEEGMGLSQSDTIQLCEDVSIVFHCAATVKFDEALRASIQMNLLGTQKLVALCHKMKKLIVSIRREYSMPQKMTILQFLGDFFKFFKKRFFQVFINLCRVRSKLKKA